MTYTELFLSYIPILLALIVMVIVLRRLGAFQQKEHRRRVEELLERIARAVEKPDR